MSCTHSTKARRERADKISFCARRAPAR